MMKNEPNFLMFLVGWFTIEFYSAFVNIFQLKSMKRMPKWAPADFHIKNLIRSLPISRMLNLYLFFLIFLNIENIPCIHIISFLSYLALEY